MVGLYSITVPPFPLLFSLVHLDVESVPVNGTWFQLIANGTTKINEGSNGLQKLDTLLRLAKKHGIYVLLTLTNNWNPRPLFDDKHSGGPLHTRDVTPGTGNNLPRNTLSNDYGWCLKFFQYFLADIG